MSVKSISKGAMPVVVGVFAAALIVRYFGDQPVIKHVAKGLKGDVVGFFK